MQRKKEKKKRKKAHLIWHKEGGKGRLNPRGPECPLRKKRKNCH